MSKTNQVCICCEARDNCPHYDTRRTICVPVKCTDWEDFSTIQDTTDWQHYRIQFVGQIASAIISNYEFYAQGIAEECKKSGKSRPEMVAQMSIEIADALIDGLEKGGKQ